MNRNESYSILGLEEGASIEEVKNAYRKLAKQYHPDRTGGDEFLANMFRKINTAYENLTSNKEQSHQQHTSSSSARQTEEKRVVLNPEIEEWIENRHKISNYIHNCKDQLTYLRKKPSKVYLSVSNIGKLVGIGFLIVFFFYPNRNAGVVDQPKTIEEAKWETIGTTDLFRVPDIKETPVIQLPVGQNVDSLGATQYFYKVKVNTEKGIQVGYILKDKLKK